ncbi:MAG: N-acetylmannosamine-6-phosphate 2-epimerase [Desulfurococcaceae archaeon]
MIDWRAKLEDFLKRTERGLIVSIQAFKGEPFYGVSYARAFARAAKIGGAVGIRTNGVSYIRAIKETVDLPIIGIYKKLYRGFEVYITPTDKEARKVVLAGADIVGIDATLRKRPSGTSLEKLIKYIKYELNTPVLADVSTIDEAIQAWKYGADIVATTLSGYTEYTKHKLNGPDFELIECIAKNINAPVIAEGRFWTHEEFRKALELGAHAVVIGTAITRPHLIVRKIVKGCIY